VKEEDSDDDDDDDDDNGDGDDDFIVMSSYPWFCWLEGSYVQHGYAQGKILTVESKLE